MFWWQIRFLNHRVLTLKRVFHLTKPKHLCSIAAMTILGGFTGMGVIWIVSGIAISMLKIPSKKLLPLTFPLFVIGWIVGAIISFVFFRSLLKTSGRTKFSQEQSGRENI